MAKIKKVIDASIDEVTFSEIKEWHEEHLDPNKIDLDDQDVYEYVYHSGRWAGIFQCVEENSLVMMSSGEQISIKDLRIGDEVMSFSEEKQIFEPKLITNVICNGRRQCLKLRFENGQELTCTPEHRILTKNRGWQEAKDLIESDEIVNFNPL